MRELTLQEIHRETLEMMDFIHRTCEENGIRYNLAYGTLIGAIRHNGFIPWDDDFDIQMTRENAEKFRQVMQGINHPYYRLCDRRNTENYYYGIPRFSDSRFRYVTTKKGIRQFDNGLFIDIYPLDNFGNTYEEAKRLKRKIVRVNTLYDIWVNGDNARGGAVALAQGIIHAAVRMIYGNRYSERIDDKVLGIIRRNTSDSDRQIGEVCWDPQIVPYRREWFGELEKHAFEDREYWIPKAYDALLREEYGDYMQLPPEEKRTAQHDYRILQE